MKRVATPESERRGSTYGSGAGIRGWCGVKGRRDFADRRCMGSGMRLVREESGQTVVFVGLFLGLIALGFLAFAVDVGLLFREKRMAQAAADGAALAASEESLAGYY